MVVMDGTGSEKHGLVARQAPREVWSHDELLAALKFGGDEAVLEAIIGAGILDENGKLSKRYSDWGNKITRTMDYDGL